MTLAALGIEASTKGVATAIDQLTELTTAAAKAEAAAERLSPTTRKAGEAAEDLADAAEEAADATRGLGEETRTTEGALARLAARVGTAVGALAAMAGVALSVQGYIRMADSWSDMRSQIGAATGDMENAGVMMQRMTDIANASYAPLNQTVQTYARNVSVLRDLGISASGAADFTESLNHMLVITATKGERAASVQNALTKAMAVGRLQAEGLETVLAHGGRVAEALADELGTTVSGLRAFASEGKITGRVIADSLIKPLQEVRDVAAEMPATMGDAFVRIGTGVTALVGSFDQAFNISGRLALSLVSVGDALRDMAQTDFASWANSLTDALIGLSQIVVILAATQIPRLVMSINAAAIGSALGTAAAWLYIAALRALALASRSVILLGGPLGIAAGVLAALSFTYINNKRNLDELRVSTGLMTEAQEELEEVTTRFYNKMTQANLDAMRIAAENNLQAVKDSLEAAKQVADSYIIPSFIPGVTGPSDAEMLATKAAQRAEVEKLVAKLIEAESRMSAVDHAASNFALRIKEGAAGVTALNDEQQKALLTANDLAASYERRAELARVEFQHGKDSAQFLETQLNQERQITFAKINALDVSNQQKEAARQSYDLMVILESKTSGWNVELGNVNGSLSAAYQALIKIRDTQPGDGWLSTAISKAAGLALTLWDAVAAQGALSRLSVSGNGAPKVMVKLGRAAIQDWQSLVQATLSTGRTLQSPTLAAVTAVAAIRMGRFKL